MSNIIEHKYNIGDTVYIVASKSNPIKTECKLCNGSGQVEIKQSIWKCPSCKGKKTKIEPNFERIPMKCTVRGIWIGKQEDWTSLNYDLVNTNGVRKRAKELKIFSCIEDVERQIDKEREKRENS